MSQTHMDPWRFVEMGWYEQAIKLYTRRYIEDGKVPHLTNRGIVYLLQEDYDAALADFQHVLDMEEPRFVGTTDYFLLGICYWCLNQPAGAVAAWQQSLTAPYTDAAGGVEAPALLLYAALRLDDRALRKEAVGLLRKRARRKLTTWPGPIVPFLLGQMAPEEFAREASVLSNDILRARHLCQADFYVALKALSAGDRDAYEAGMIRCAKSPYKFLEHEYYLARWEVRHDFPDPAFAHGVCSNA